MQSEKMRVLRKSKKEVLAEFRTAELLEAARRVFSKKGFHDATVDEIAATAGVAKGTVYLYYPSKRAIYWAALKHGIVDLLQQIHANVKEAKTVQSKLRAFIATKVSYFEVDRAFFKIYLLEFGNALTHSVHLYKDFEELYFQQVGILSKLLQEAARQKLIRPVRLEATAHAISDVIRGVITQRLLGWSKARIDREIEFIYELIWRGIESR